MSLNELQLKKLLQKSKRLHEKELDRKGDYLLQKQKHIQNIYSSIQNMTKKIKGELSVAKEPKSTMGLEKAQPVSNQTFQRPISLSKKSDGDKINFQRAFKLFLKNKWDLGQLSTQLPVSSQFQDFQNDEEFESVDLRHRQGGSKAISDSYFYQTLNLLIESKYEQLKKVGLKRQNVFNYLIKNKDLMFLFNLDPQNIGHQIKTFKTKLSQHFELQEFARFLTLPRKVVNPQNWHMFDTDCLQNQIIQSQKDLKVEFVGGQYFFQLFQGAFSELDIYCTGKVRMDRLLSYLSKQSIKDRMLNNAVIRFNSLKKILQFEDLLVQLQFQNQIKQITQQEFLEWVLNFRWLIKKSRFRIYHRRLTQGRMDSALASALPFKYLQIIAKVFQRCKIYQIFVQKKQFFDRLTADPNFILFQKHLIRQLNTADLPIQNVTQALNRMLKQAENYISMNEVLMFLSVKGRPVTARLVQNKQIGAETEGSDEQNQRFERIKNLKKVRIIQKKKKQDMIESRRYKITAPQPFHINQGGVKANSIRQRRLEQDRLRRQMEHLQQLSQFRAKPPPDFDKLQSKFKSFQQKQKCRAERKKRKAEQLQEKLRVRQLQKTISQDRPSSTAFKARDVPQHVYQSMLDQIERQNITRRAFIREDVKRRHQNYTSIGQKIQQRYSALRQRWFDSKLQREVNKSNNTPLLLEVKSLQNLLNPQIRQTLKSREILKLNKRRIKTARMLEARQMDSRPGSSKMQGQRKFLWRRLNRKVNSLTQRDSLIRIINQKKLQSARIQQEQLRKLQVIRERVLQKKLLIEL